LRLVWRFPLDSMVPLRFWFSCPITGIRYLQIDSFSFSRFLIASIFCYLGKVGSLSVEATLGIVPTLVVEVRSAKVAPSSLSSPTWKLTTPRLTAEANVSIRSFCSGLQCKIWRHLFNNHLTDEAFLFSVTRVSNSGLLQQCWGFHNT
jgi:hypothetical protein